MGDAPPVPLPARATDLDPAILASVPSSRFGSRYDDLTHVVIPEALTPPVLAALAANTSLKAKLRDPRLRETLELVFAKSAVHGLKLPRPWVAAARATARSVGRLSPSVGVADTENVASPPAEPTAVADAEACPGFTLLPEDVDMRKFPHNLLSERERRVEASLAQARQVPAFDAFCKEVLDVVGHATVSKSPC
jgi:hypothetical protein